MASVQTSAHNYTVERYEADHQNCCTENVLHSRIMFGACEVCVWCFYSFSHREGESRCCPSLCGFWRCSWSTLWRTASVACVRAGESRCPSANQAARHEGWHATGLPTSSPDRKINTTKHDLNSKKNATGLSQEGGEKRKRARNTRKEKKLY